MYVCIYLFHFGSSSPQQKTTPSLSLLNVSTFLRARVSSGVAFKSTSNFIKFLQCKSFLKLFSQTIGKIIFTRVKADDCIQHIGLVVVRETNYMPFVTRIMQIPTFSPRTQRLIIVFASPVSAAWWGDGGENMAMFWLGMLIPGCQEHTEGQPTGCAVVNIRVVL